MPKQISDDLRKELSVKVPPTLAIELFVPAKVILSVLNTMLPPFALMAILPAVRSIPRVVPPVVVKFKFNGPALELTCVFAYRTILPPAVTFNVPPALDVLVMFDKKTSAFNPPVLIKLPAAPMRLIGELMIKPLEVPDGPLTAITPFNCKKPLPNTRMPTNWGGAEEFTTQFDPSAFILTVPTA